MRAGTIVLAGLLLVSCASAPVERYARDGLTIESRHSVDRDEDAQVVDYSVYLQRRSVELERVRVRAFGDLDGDGRFGEGEPTEVKDYSGSVNVLEYERSGWKIERGEPWLQIELEHPGETEPEIVAWPLE